MNTLSNVRLPAIYFGKPNCTMHRVDDLKLWTTKSFRYAGLKSTNRLVESFLVDSNGQIHHLRHLRLATKVGAIKSFFLSWLNPRVSVEFAIVKVGKVLDAKELRMRMLEDIAEYEDYWSELSDYEDFVQRVERSNTIEGLIAALPF